MNHISRACANRGVEISWRFYRDEQDADIVTRRLVERTRVMDEVVRHKCHVSIAATPHPQGRENKRSNRNVQVRMYLL